MGKEKTELKKNKSWLGYLLIFFAAFLLYANTIPHEYVWDDKIVIEKNPRVQKGIQGIPDLFVKYNSQFQYDKYGYRPITLVSFAVDYSIGKGSPGFSHFMNAFYYGILCVLIFIFLSALFKEYHSIFPLIICFLFIVHPLHVEVVANIKSRDEIFGMLFSVLSFISFIRYLQDKKILFLLYTFLAYMIAYLSKENVITVLAIYPLIMLIRRTKISKPQVIISTLSIVVLCGISFMIYYLASHSKAGIETSMGKGIYEENGILGNSFFHLSGFGRKLPNAIHVLGLYLKNFIIPYPLVFYYGYNVIPVTGWGNIAVIISLLVHLTLLIVGIKYIKKRPEILFGFLFYAVTISIYTHLFRTLSDTMADRFLFTSSLGLCILLVGLVGLIFKIDWLTNPNKKQKDDRALKTFTKNNRWIVYGFGSVCVIFSVLSFSRNRVWESDYTLVSHDLPYLENCSRVHYYYADLIDNQMARDQTLPNNPQKKMKMEADMIKHYKRSMELSDHAYLSYIQLANYYCREYRYNEGIPIYQKAVTLFPEASDLLFYLGQTYVLTNQNEAAVPLLEKSLQNGYNQPTNYYFLAMAYSRTGKYQQALKVVEDGMKKFENEKMLFYDALGFIYFEHNELDKSIACTLKMAEYGKPEQTVYSYVIGRCFAKGDTLKGNHYREEARLKGIVFQ